MDENNQNDDLNVENNEEMVEPAEVAEETEEAAPEDQIDWKERAERAEAAIVKAKQAKKSQPKETLTNQPKTSVEDTEDIRETVKTLAVSEKKRQFGYKHGLSPEEVDAVFRIDPNPTKETLEDPFVKGGLGNVKRMKRISDNSPSPTSKSSSIGTMDFNKLDEHQKQAKFEDYMSKRLK